MQRRVATVGREVPFGKAVAQFAREVGFRDAEPFGGDGAQAGFEVGHHTVEVHPEHEARISAHAVRVPASRAAWAAAQ